MQPKLSELIIGTGECKRLCSALWPDEWEQIRQESVAAFRLWLNEKTGLDVTGDALAGFGHWLPRLREMMQGK